jgi:hypothetical protein
MRRCSHALICHAETKRSEGEASLRRLKFDALEFENFVIAEDNGDRSEGEASSEMRWLKPEI